MTSLIERLRTEADRHMPAWASSVEWYNTGGRRERDLANLLREAADALDNGYEDRLAAATERHLRTFTRGEPTTNERIAAEMLAMMEVRP